MTRDDSLMRCVMADAAATELEKRYEHRRRLWLDGPYGGSVAFDKVTGREVGLYIAYNFTDIPAFVSQAKARRRLRHPHLLPVLDFGMTADNRPYFTEPYTDAQSLDSLFGDSTDPLPCSLPQLVRTFIGVCQAVAHAHENGFCHLDLTPGDLNASPTLDDVFITGGWFEFIPVPAPVEEHVGVCFKPFYAAPEQAQFSNPELIRRGLWRAVDVHGLGGILYWLLYGSDPNQPSRAGGSIQDIAQSLVSRKGSPRPGELRPAFQTGTNVVSDLQRVALKALHGKPHRRHPTVNDMIAELEACLVEDRRARPWWKFW